jgi:hypothetical protein
MKNQVSNNVRSFFRSTITTAAFAFMLIAGSIPSVAQTAEKNAETEIPVKVTYLGKVNFQPVFQIDIDNRKANDLYVTMKDEDGTLLYANRFNNLVFSKKFRFDTEDANSINVTLSLTSKNEKKTQVLKFSNVFTTVEDVVVTRVH